MAFYFNSPFFGRPFGAFGPFGRSPFDMFDDVFDRFPVLPPVFYRPGYELEDAEMADADHEQAEAGANAKAQAEASSTPSPVEGDTAKAAMDTAAEPAQVKDAAASTDTRAGEGTVADKAPAAAEQQVAVPAPASKPFSLALHRTDADYKLSYTLPASAPKDKLEISLSDDGSALTFKFEDRQESEGRKTYRRVERVWALPKDADSDKINAAWKDGKVEVIVGRKEVKEQPAGKKLISVL